MRTPKVMPHANKSVVNTSVRAHARSAKKAARTHSGSQSSKGELSGLAMVGGFICCCLFDLLLQTGLLG